MNILNRKIASSLAHKLTVAPSYQVYIHLQDHDKKVNPKDGRLHLSYMDPKKQTENALTNPPFSAKLRKTAQEELRKRLFEQYKEKILQGTVDQEAVVEVDQLWGDQEIPVHYYQNLSRTQVLTVSHSIVKDVQHLQQQLVQQFLKSSIKTTSLADAKQANQYAQVAAHYRLTGITARQQYYQVQKAIGNKPHLLSNRALILLKYAMVSSPKYCTPEFNIILNHLLGESLQQLSVEELVHLMFFNRFDLFRMHKGNLQIAVIEAASRKFGDLTLQQKVDFLFLFVDSRSPTIRREAHNRYHQEIRNRTQEIIYHLDIDADLSTLSETSVLKLAYSLVRAKTNTTDHITLSICEYIEANIDKISAQNQALFFIYLNQIQGGKSIANIQLMKSLKQKVLSSWQQHSTITKLRALSSMHNLGLYDEAAQQLYSAIPISADSSILAHFCRLEIMNSSGREWEVVHRLVELDFVPLQYYQDCKRFYNYVSVTAPQWKLDPLENKLKNTQMFYSSVRYESVARDKKYYKAIRDFQKFSNIQVLPKPFVMGAPIKNIEFAQLCLPKYQICLDVITDVQRIRGTRDLKGSYLAKIKSLECLGWKQLYVFEQDIQKLAPVQFFNYIYSVCQPHFEQQLNTIAQYEAYRSYQIEQLRRVKMLKMLKMRERQQYEVVKDFNLLESEDTIRNKDIQAKDQELKERGQAEAQRRLKAQGLVQGNVSK